MISPSLNGMPSRAREADRGGRARVGDRQHEVGVDRRLAREPLAHPHARAVHLDAVELGVGPREIEELEDAERAAARAGSTACTVCSPLPSTTHGSRRVDLAHELGADEIERARLRRDDPVVVDAPEHERAEAVRVAEGDERPSESATIEYAPSSRCIAFATASSSGASSFAISAAITSLSDVARSVTPSARRARRAARPR